MLSISTYIKGCYLGILKLRDFYNIILSEKVSRTLKLIHVCRDHPCLFIDVIWKSVTLGHFCLLCLHGRLGNGVNLENKHDVWLVSFLCKFSQIESIAKVLKPGWFQRHKWCVGKVSGVIWFLAAFQLIRVLPHILAHS